MLQLRLLMRQRRRLSQRYRERAADLSRAPLKQLASVTLALPTAKVELLDEDGEILLLASPAHFCCLLLLATAAAAPASSSRALRVIGSEQQRRLQHDCSTLTTTLRNKGRAGLGEELDGGSWASSARTTSPGSRQHHDSQTAALGSKSRT